MNSESVHVTFEWLAAMLPEELKVKKIKTVEPNPDRDTLTVYFEGERNRLNTEGACGYMHPLVSTHDIPSKPSPPDTRPYEYIGPSRNIKVTARWDQCHDSRGNWNIRVYVRRRGGTWLLWDSREYPGISRQEAIEKVRLTVRPIRNQGSSLAESLYARSALASLGGQMSPVPLGSEEEIEDEEEDDD